MPGIRNRPKLTLVLLVACVAVACVMGLVSRLDSVKAYRLRRAIAAGELQPLNIAYPFDNAVFPPEIVAPVFRWSEPDASATSGW
jgi:hypothetical protein